MSSPQYPAMPRRRFLTGAAGVGIGAGIGLVSATTVYAATAAAPTIFSDADWSARPPSSPVSLVGARPNKIVVHHTAFENTPDATQAEAFAIAHEIQDLHMDKNGWIDSGQHFTISRGGHIMEGRHRSLETLQAGNDMVVGAHTVGQNSSGIGIENNGTYTTVTPPQALFASLTAFCAYICSQYGLDPAEIYGHRDFNSTECPGDVLYSMLPQLRSGTAAKLRELKRS